MSKTGAIGNYIPVAPACFWPRLLLIHAVLRHVGVELLAVLLLLRLNGIEHLPRHGRAELEHAGIVHGGDVLSVSERVAAMYASAHAQATAGAWAQAGRSAGTGCPAVLAWAFRPAARRRACVLRHAVNDLQMLRSFC